MTHSPFHRPSGQSSQSVFPPIGCLLRGLFLGSVAAGLAIIPTSTHAAPGQRLSQPHAPSELSAHPPQSGIIIYPPVVWPYPRPAPARGRVQVVFEAQGSDWGAVYLDGRPIYRYYNHNREETIYLNPGGYRLEITGVVRADLWASGYLDIGRDDSRIVVIRFSKETGVEVAGAPYVWIPDQ